MFINLFHLSVNQSINEKDIPWLHPDFCFVFFVKCRNSVGNRPLDFQTKIAYYMFRILHIPWGGHVCLCAFFGFSLKINGAETVTEVNTWEHVNFFLSVLILSFHELNHNLSRQALKCCSGEGNTSLIFLSHFTLPSLYLQCQFYLPYVFWQ